MSAGPQRDVVVRLGERSYSVRVGSGLIADAGKLIVELAESGPLLVVSNPTVTALYGDTLVQALDRAGVRPQVVIEIPDGERHKTLSTVEMIYDRALESGVDRSSILIALGGGVVGDVAGFAAATLLRGVRLVMIPTTLLAQVDSSVGGKTGVNRRHGKNLVGAFHQPALVVADPRALRTLPEREYRAGLAEVVKYGMIFDEALFALIEQRLDAVVARDPDLLTDVVARCVELKAGVVERDEKEAGLRRVLNFGHTVGHALEQVTDYERYLHGEAVAIGMVAAARLSSKLGACEESVGARLEALLAALDLEHSLPPDLDRDRLERAIGVDKKVRGGEVEFVVSEGVGKCRLQRVTPADVRAAL